MSAASRSLGLLSLSVIAGCGSINGTWEGDATECVAEGQTRTIQLVISNEGGGEFEADFVLDPPNDPMHLVHGTIDGDKVRFKYGDELDSTRFEGTLDRRNDTIAGKCFGDCSADYDYCGDEVERIGTFALSR